MFVIAARSPPPPPPPTTVDLTTKGEGGDLGDETCQVKIVLNCFRFQVLKMQLLSDVNVTVVILSSKYSFHQQFSYIICYL